MREYLEELRKEAAIEAEVPLEERSLEELAQLAGIEKTAVLQWLGGKIRKPLMTAGEELAERAGKAGGEASMRAMKESLDPWLQSHLKTVKKEIAPTLREATQESIKGLKDEATAAIRGVTGAGTAGALSGAITAEPGDRVSGATRGAVGGLIGGAAGGAWGRSLPAALGAATLGGGIAGALNRSKREQLGIPSPSLAKAAMQLGANPQFGSDSKALRQRAEAAAQRVLNQNTVESSTAQAGLMAGGLLGSAAGMAVSKALTGDRLAGGLLGGALGAFGGGEMGAMISEALQNRRMAAQQAAEKMPEAVKQAGLVDPVIAGLKKVREVKRFLMPSSPSEMRETTRGTEIYGTLVNPGPHLRATKPSHEMEVFPDATVTPTIGIGKGGLQSRFRVLIRKVKGVPNDSVVGRGLNTQSAVTGGSEVGVRLRHAKP